MCQLYVKGKKKKKYVKICLDNLDGKDYNAVLLCDFSASICIHN